MKDMGEKEAKFWEALEDLFVGAEIEGEGGYVNLMKIKRRYYQGLKDKLKSDIDQTLQTCPDFREELFDKLYDFFSRYFSESGSIYFTQTRYHKEIYEKIYTNEKDVILFWKTQNLYYVKTDRIFRNLDVELDNFKFHFNTKTLEYKKANEKRNLIYELDKVENGTIYFNVYYSEKGKETKIEDILKELNKKI